jgi:hypothetical protein
MRISVNIPQMRLRTGIRRKLWVVFVLQLAAISFATISRATMSR